MRYTGFALRGREELMGFLALSQISNKPSYGTKNDGQERQCFDLVAYDSLGFKFSLVNATRFWVVAGI